MSAAAVLAGINSAQLAFINPADIADGVNRVRPQGIAPGQIGFDVHPLATGTDLSLAGRFPHRSTGSATDAGIRRTAAGQFAESLNVGVGEGDALTQFRQRGIQILDLFTGDFQMVGSQIIRQQHAVAVEDEAASGRQRLQANPVAIRQGGKLLVIENLQIDQSAGDRQKAQENREQHGQGAPKNNSLSATLSFPD